MPPKFLFCECHGNQVMAHALPDGTVKVKARHHGQDHYLTIDPEAVKAMTIEEHVAQVVASSSN